MSSQEDNASREFDIGNTNVISSLGVYDAATTPMEKNVITEQSGDIFARLESLFPSHIFECQNPLEPTPILEYTEENENDFCARTIIRRQVTFEIKNDSHWNTGLE